MKAQLTEANFYDVARTFGAAELWGLTAPLPELRWLDPHTGEIVLRIRLGDTIEVSKS